MILDEFGGHLGGGGHMTVACRSAFAGCRRVSRRRAQFVLSAAAYSACLCAYISRCVVDFFHRRAPSLSHV